MGQATRRVPKQSVEKKSASKLSVWVQKAKATSIKDKLRPIPERWGKFPAFHRYTLMVLVPVTLVVICLPTGQSVDDALTTQMSRHSVSLNLPVIQTQLQKQEQRDTGTPEGANQPDVWQSPVTDRWYRFQMPANTVMSAVFKSKSFSAQDLQEIVAVQGKTNPLTSILPGQWIRYKLKDGKLQQIAFETNNGPAIFQKIRGTFQKTLAVN